MRYAGTRSQAHAAVSPALEADSAAVRVVLQDLGREHLWELEDLGQDTSSSADATDDVLRYWEYWRIRLGTHECIVIFLTLTGLGIKQSDTKWSDTYMKK